MCSKIEVSNLDQTSGQCRNQTVPKKLTLERWTLADWAEVWWRGDSTGAARPAMVVCLLGQVDRKLGLMGAAARCIADPRSPMQIKYGVRDMLRHRVCVLALG